MTHQDRKFSRQAAEQTSGKDLPTPPTPALLDGAAPDGLWDAIQAQVTAHGYTASLVNSAAVLDGANGRTTFASKTVEVRADMDEAARVKTLIHELGHVLLHDPDTLKAAFTGKPMPELHHLEVEAESVAYSLIWTGCLHEGVGVVFTRRQFVDQQQRSLVTVPLVGAIPGREAGGVQVERPERSEDERPGGCRPHDPSWSRGEGRRAHRARPIRGGVANAWRVWQPAVCADSEAGEYEAAQWAPVCR